MVYFVIDIIRLPEAVKKYNKRKKVNRRNIGVCKGRVEIRYNIGDL